jgi:hypothetical protein
MAALRQLSSPLKDDAFVSMQSYRDGAKPGDGGTALAMASSAPTIKRALYGLSKQRLSVRSPHSNSNAMRQRVNGLLGPSNNGY